MRVQVVDPSAYTPPYDRALSAALARAGADVELVTSRFAYGDVPAAEGYRVSELFYRRAGRFGGKAQLHPRTAAAGRNAGSIEQLHPAAMLLENAADDGKAQTGAFFTGGDVGFEQPVAIFLRQADAVVDHVNKDAITAARRDHADAATAARALGNGDDGLGRILDDVGEPLRDQSAVEPRRHRVL